jgi:hypothetical protein
MKIEELEKLCSEVMPLDYFLEDVDLCGCTASNYRFIAAARTAMPVLLEIARAAKDFEYNFEREKDCDCCSSNAGNLAEVRETLAKLESL